jgi:chemotaxis signal transduction protein
MGNSNKYLQHAINSMAEIANYNNELNALGQSWDFLTVLGQMSGGTTDMKTTREGFRKLADDLIKALSEETLRVVVEDIAAKAKGIIGILNRNLFERTADIGFLATDNDLRSVLLNADDSASKERLVKRFADYVAKYSVYSDILLLNKNGQVVAKLDNNNPVTSSDDPLLSEALTTGKDYVETYGESDLFPNAGKVLLYSYRVTSPDNPANVLGVLCLRFRFQDEMQGIFSRLVTPEDWHVLTLLDANGEVLSSSSPQQLPVGAKVDMALEQEFKIMRYAGQRYIAKTIAASGYQGYSGLGWRGHVMVPLAYAFETNAAASQQLLDKVLAENQFATSTLFSEQIRQIPQQAEVIQANLDRTVWNGNILSNNADNMTFKVLLREISNAGFKTKAVFEKAIANLQRKVLVCQMNEVAHQAATALDIMDRNLYERANDCRWWALTSEFRRILTSKVSSKTIAATDTEQLAKVLRHINGLYTVYSQLLIYDANGNILAGSTSESHALVGQGIEAEWLRRTTGLRNPQHYTVSAFEPSPFYLHKATYIYSAPIFHTEHPTQVVGGIAVVFDSEPQFNAMLNDCLPVETTGQVVAGAFGVFIDSAQTIIASTDARFPVGATLAVNVDFANLSADKPVSMLLVFNGRQYAVGIQRSAGYREFKSAADCYQNTVYSVMFADLGESCTAAKSTSQAPRLVMQGTQQGKAQNDAEIATFSISNRNFGIKVKSIVEALEHTKLAPIPNSPSSVLGSLFYKGKPILVMNPFKALGCAPNLNAADLQIVLVDTDIGPTGIVVEHLGEIFRLDQQNAGKDSYADTRSASCVEEILTLGTTEEDSQLLVVLNPNQLVKQLMAA